MPKLERMTVPRVSYSIPLLSIFTFCWSPDGDHDALIQVWNLEICDYNQQICLVKIAKLADLILEPYPPQFSTSEYSLLHQGSFWKCWLSNSLPWTVVSW